MAPERLSIDRGLAIEAELNEQNSEHWIAGPIPLYSVDVTRDGDGHYVVIAGDNHSSWEATAGHEISRKNPQVVCLHGREAFQSPVRD